MASYFWYAERDEKSPTHPHLNQASGLIHGYDPVGQAWDKAMREAREDLGNTKGFTIKQFNKVGE